MLFILKNNKIIHGQGSPAKKIVLKEMFILGLLNILFGDKTLNFNKVIEDFIDGDVNCNF